MKRLRLFLLTILCGKEVADMAIVYATLIVKLSLIHISEPTRH